MQLFYIPDTKDEKIVTLDKEQSSHIARVLRMKEGEEISLTNGKGDIFLSKILDVNHNHTTAEIIDINSKYHQRDYYIHLCIAPTKNIARIEWLIEKSVEIGIDEITPILCQRSERKSINVERLNKIIISAMCQSLKAYKPVLNPMQKFTDVMHNLKEQKHYICHCAEGEKKFIYEDYKAKESCIIFIGPEGDFSHEEIEKSRQYGFSAITLGNERLRTETAALYAISNIHFINQMNR